MQIVKPNLQLFPTNFQNIITRLDLIKRLGGANFTIVEEEDYDGLAMLRGTKIRCYVQR